MTSPPGASSLPAGTSLGRARDGRAGGDAFASRGLASRVAFPRDTARRAFTLIEILVVIMIIGILAGIVMPVLAGAKLKAMKEWARKEVNEIGSALDLYHQDHGAYPPDTLDWGAKGGNEDFIDHDPFTLRRYLGLEVVNLKGEKFQAYYGMQLERLGERQVDPTTGYTVGKFLDPFEVAYEYDAMHMVPPGELWLTTDEKSWRQSGWPYLEVLQPGDPSDDETRQMVLEYKVLSKGPDQLSAKYPFDPDPGDADLKYTTDDICPWR